MLRHAETQDAPTTAAVAKLLNTSSSLIVPQKESFRKFGVIAFSKSLILMAFACCNSSLIQTLPGDQWLPLLRVGVLRIDLDGSRCIPPKTVECVPGGEIQVTFQHLRKATNCALPNQ